MRLTVEPAIERSEDFGVPREKAYGYGQAAQAGNTIYVSGQLSHAEKGKLIGPATLDVLVARRDSRSRASTDVRAMSAPLEISSVVSGVGGETFGTLPMRRPQRTDLAPWRAKRVRLYIEANLERRLDTDVLARVVYASRAHFCRTFKQTFGVTVHRYVMQRRIERAQQLMLTTSRTLGEIAVACGMSDHSHFTRVFRGELCESPSIWRKRHGG